MNIGAENIKAIAIDLDGTVLNSASLLSEKTLSVLHACTRAGISIIISTGRSVSASERYSAQIGATGPMVYYNGAAVVDIPSEKILEKHFIDLEVVSWCTELSRKENVHFQVFLSEAKETASEILLAENPSNATQLYHKRTGLDFKFGDLRAALSNNSPPECIKGIFIDDHEKLEPIRKKINEHFGSKVNLVLSADYILEVLSPEASKGSALLSALRFRGIDKKNVISFGDEENDLSMFKVTGYSAAPSNARQTIKDAATFVIDSNDQDGVAVFLSGIL